MKRWMMATMGGVILVGGVGFGMYRHLRGPSGGSTAYGGSIAATVVPEFPSSDPSAWANGSPAMLASLRGSPVLLEAWSPS
jgi:hypothetical protein